MNDDDDWNICDDAMLARLETFRIGRYNQPVKVMRVKFDEPSGTMQASGRSGEQWNTWALFTAVLDALPQRGEPVAPKPMDNMRNPPKLDT